MLLLAISAFIDYIFNFKLLLPVFLIGAFGFLHYFIFLKAESRNSWAAIIINVFSIGAILVILNVFFQSLDIFEKLWSEMSSLNQTLIILACYHFGVLIYNKFAENKNT